VSPFELVRLLTAHWKRHLIAMLVFGVFGYFVAARLPAYYRTQLVLAPAAQLSADTGGLGGLASRIGGLASVAGIQLGAARVDRETITLETLRGPTFLIGFAQRRALVLPLFAGKSYDPSKGEWQLDPKIYDVKKGTWTPEAWARGNSGPSDADIFKEISQRISVEEDRRTGIIRVSVESRSPIVAVQWASTIIEDLNNYVRDKDVQEAKKTLEYLQQQVGTTQVSEMRSIFFALIEEQTKTLMLAHARPEYALKVIDSPVLPDKPSWPRRRLLAALAALAGLALATASVLIPRVLGAK
jgi:hypothetical protein